MTSLPQLLALAVEPQEAWGSLDSLDPYRCNLVLTALAACSADVVAHHMKGHSGTCEVHPLSSSETRREDASLPVRAREILKAQISLIDASTPASFVGQIASAGRTAVNVLRACGRIGHAELLSAATEQSLEERTSAVLRDALDEALSSRQAGVTPDGASSPAPSTGISTLRVDARRVDALVRLTGELTVAQNAMGHILKLARAQENPLAGVLKERHDVAPPPGE